MTGILAGCEFMSSDLLPEVRRLMSEGKGEDAISRALGITRHTARKLTSEVQRADKGNAGGPIEIPVALCRASPTARPIKPGHVLVLVESIKEIGLRQPINVRAIENGYEIRGGGHRHAAFQMLGRETIPAIVTDDSDLRAELAEIDENLIRNEYSPAERAIAIARRKSIYEALHPETAHGGARKASRKVCDLNEGDKTPEKPADRFTKATAERTGQSERTVQQDAKRGEVVGPETLQRVIGTSLDKGEEIDALAKLSPQGREEVIAKAEAGGKVSAKVLVKQERREEREESLADKIAALPTRQTGWERHSADLALNVGKAAEHIVCADALMRGYEAFLSGQGAPYDLVIEKDGRLFKVQVKGAQAARNVNSSGVNPRIAYSFAALRRGKDGDGPRLTKREADIIACVALDTLQIAYLPVFECSTTIQLEPDVIPDNGYVRTYDRPIGKYPLDAAIARVMSEGHYTELQKTFPPFPKKRYGVILADPPWAFSTYSENGLDRSADNHYPTLDTDTLCGVGPYVPAADDCVLFLWATSPMLPDALRVMEAWGFTYKSHFIWNKDKIGTGYWNRNKHELLLVGTRGNIPAPAMGEQAHSVIDAPVRLHSEKPAAFYLLIENYFPNLPKIELNARRARPGWEAWGLEAPASEAAE